VSVEALEALLARVYTDAETRRRFLADPQAEARRAGVGEVECASLTDIDAKGLALAAESFAAKRARAARMREAGRARLRRRRALPWLGRWTAPGTILARLTGRR
jgi:hypothetical protein